jgi:hypothetical protein
LSGVPELRHEKTVSEFFCPPAKKTLTISGGMVLIDSFLRRD